MGTREQRPDRGTEYAHLAPLFDGLVGLSPDDPRRVVLRDDLVAGHLPVAQHIARRFTHRGEPIEDLEQVATLGLINAVDRFDPERGADFLSFAVPTITGEVRRYFRDRGWAMRVPRRLKDIQARLNAAMSELSQDLGRAPTVGELAARLDLPRQEIIDGLEAAHAYRGESLERITQDDEAPGLSRFVGTEDDEYALVEDRHVLVPLLAGLPARERAIVVLRFVDGLTQSEIGDRLGISQMHVSRLLSRTLDTLRRRLTD